MPWTGCQIFPQGPFAGPLPVLSGLQAAALGQQLKQAFAHITLRIISPYCQQAFAYRSCSTSMLPTQLSSLQARLPDGKRTMLLHVLHAQDTATC